MDPARSCPVHYRYAPEALNQKPALITDTLYVVGGLYGNVEALASLIPLIERERVYGPAQVVFNGDFNWFDIAPADFALINRRVLEHTAILGNVEAELAEPSDGAGCGCAYPEEVDTSIAARSDQIMERLQRTAAGFPDIRQRLRALPLHLTALVGGVRVAVVHGDAHSLAGWNFDQARLPVATDPTGLAALAELFRRANCQVFASSHTCLPCAQDLVVDGQVCAVINNGAAGMPNFAQDLRGVITRLSIHRPRVPTLYGREFDGIFVSAVPLTFDLAAWQRRFLRQWSPGSPAHVSYFSRISQGTAFTLEQAARGGFQLSCGSHPHVA